MQEFSKCVPKSVALVLASPGTLSEADVLGPYSRTIESDTQEDMAQQFVFYWALSPLEVTATVLCNGKHKTTLSMKEKE